MENKIDQFFKNKIEDHSLPPSEVAWNKVAANLSKKNNAIAWRIAAGILLIGTFISLIYWSQQSKPVPPSIAKGKPNKENKSGAPERKSELQALHKKNKRALDLGKKSGKQTVHTPTITKNSNLNKLTEEIALQPIREEEKNVVTPAPIDETKGNTIVLTTKNIIKEKLQLEATPLTKVASPARKSIKLEYTLDDFAPEEKAIATNEMKNSGLKRVLELAREVKNGEGPIRDIKNELFALNFKKNKNQ